MATRYTTIGGSLAALTAIGITIGTAADGPAVRTAIGAAATVTTTRGDLIRRGASADERLALGTSGHVLTSNGTDAVWSAPTSSITVGSGTYASRPASPAVGDLYTVTSGARIGSVYACRIAGSWELERVAPPPGVAPGFYLDAERFDGVASGMPVIVWPGEVNGIGAQALSTFPAITVLPSAGGGQPGVSFAATNSGLRVAWRGASGSSTRWIALVLSRITTSSSTFDCLFGYGTNSGSALFAGYSRYNNSNVYAAGFFAAQVTSSTAPDTGTTPQVLLWQHTGGTTTIYRNGSSIASGAVSLSTGTTYPLTIGANILGSEPSAVTIQAVLGGDTALDSTAIAAIQARAQARFGVP